MLVIIEFLSQFCDLMMFSEDEDDDGDGLDDDEDSDDDGDGKEDL